LPADELNTWRAAEPRFPSAGATTAGELAHDARAAARYSAEGEALLRRLPAKPHRDARAQAAAEALKARLREARTQFLRAYGELLYAELTHDYRDFVRAEALVYLAAERYPGVTP